MHNHHREVLLSYCPTIISPQAHSNLHRSAHAGCPKWAAYYTMHGCCLLTENCKWRKERLGDFFRFPSRTGRGKKKDKLTAHAVFDNRALKHCGKRKQDCCPVPDLDNVEFHLISPWNSQEWSAAELPHVKTCAILFPTPPQQMQQWDSSNNNLQILWH